MDSQELKIWIKDLPGLPQESAWVELKVYKTHTQEIGEYISGSKILCDGYVTKRIFLISIS